VKSELDLWYEMWDRVGSQGLDTWYDMRSTLKDEPDALHSRNVDGLDDAPLESAGGHEGG
jgi:hypothetical protein